MTKQEFIDEKVSETLPAEVHSWNMAGDDRRIEWGRALMKMYGSDLSVYQLLAKNLYDFAEAIAAEREKRYGAFDGEPTVSSDDIKKAVAETVFKVTGIDPPDPYAVDWSEAPDEGFNYHAVDVDDEAFWFRHKPKLPGIAGAWSNTGSINDCEVSNWKGPNPNYTTSLRERPKTK